MSDAPDGVSKAWQMSGGPASAGAATSNSIEQDSSRCFRIVMVSTSKR
jgi:hypothetical protein